MSAFRRHFIFMSLTKMGGKDRVMSGKEIALYSVLGVWGVHVEWGQRGRLKKKKRKENLNFLKPFNISN